MADIQEILLDGSEIMQDIAEEIRADEESEPLQEAPASEEVKPVIKPKAKGRPKGSCNKGPSKPRAKKTQIQETPVEAPVEEITYQPSSPKRNQTAHGP